ncbi:MAG: hypothetical protein ACTHJ0_04220 [Flavipsychrobacter sp.]
MSELNTARIPFRVRLEEGNFKGEAIGIGDSLKDNSMFEVHMEDGGSFLVKAEVDLELQRYTWSSHDEKPVHKLIPFIGRVIERYYKSLSA